MHITKAKKKNKERKIARKGTKDTEKGEWEGKKKKKKKRGKGRGM